MKNIFLITLLIPVLSACGIVGTAVNVTTKVVKTAVDVVVENDTDQNEDTTALAFNE